MERGCLFLPPSLELGDCKGRGWCSLVEGKDTNFSELFRSLTAPPSEHISSSSKPLLATGPQVTFLHWSISTVLLAPPGLPQKSLDWQPLSSPGCLPCAVGASPPSPQCPPALLSCEEGVYLLVVAWLALLWLCGHRDLRPAPAELHSDAGRNKLMPGWHILVSMTFCTTRLT